ncbi:MAG: DNA polymerase III subunit beta [Erysipelotrichaceae bacterium]
MYFKVSKKEFYIALQTVSRAISSYSPLPAFSGIKLEVLEDCMYLTGSDSDVSIQTRLDTNRSYLLEIYNKGSIVIEAKYILDIVRKIDHDTIEVEIIENALTKISGSTAEFRINGMNAQDYPMIDFYKPDRHFTLEADVLKNAISQTSFAASDKETRPVLTGVNLTCANQRLEMVATDSYRLARKLIPLEKDVTFNITIPAKSLNEVSKTIDHEGTIEIAVSDKKVQFIIDQTIIQTRLIDGAYPETKRLVPETFEFDLVLDSKEILGAIDRASFIKNDGVSVIKLAMSERNSVLSTRSLEVGSSTEELQSAQFHGMPLEISFNGRYVFDAIKAIGGSMVKFSFCGEMKPFVITSMEDETILQLVLPVRTYS